jgi:hypothetical protein
MDASKMATSLSAEMASLQSTGKKIGGGSKGKVFRGRVQIVAFLVVIGVVVGVAQHVAKKGLPDIDPVKVRVLRARARPSRRVLEARRRRGLARERPPAASSAPRVPSSRWSSE